MDARHPAIVALTAVLADAANLLRVPSAEIAVAYLEAQDWPDSCLGLAGPDEGCADVITPGYRIVLGSPGDGFVYRTDQQGNIRREPTGPSETGRLHVHFARTGGIGGFRNEVELDTDTLPPDEAQELKRLVEQAGFWNLPEQIDNGQPVADGFSYVIRASIGRRNRTVTTYDGSKNGSGQYPGFPELLAWLGGRVPFGRDAPQVVET